ncbi:MAG TPA: DedA family protein [Solirubrobacteraceae bacterium]|jgi:membrane protein DedA with SNARE-associated domain
MVLASISSSITQWIAENGVYAVFALMALDALLPVGGELVMLFAGVLASGSVASAHATFLGVDLANGAEGYVVLALAGTLGYLVGALVGWAIGRTGGRVLVERHGRRFHVGPDALLRAERWFDRFGLWAVLLGRVTPVVRSFISIPAGVFRAPLPAYVLLSLIGSAVWCFAFAAAGWALGGSWKSFHHGFGYVDIALVAVLIAAIVVFALRHLRARRRRAEAASAGGERADPGARLPD